MHHATRFLDQIARPFRQALFSNGKKLGELRFEIIIDDVLPVGEVKSDAAFKLLLLHGR